MRLFLKNDLYALVDDTAPADVRQAKWSLRPDGYVVRHIKGGMQLLHRLLAGAGAGQVVDHINGDKLDNRMANLRVCTQRENLYNRRVGRVNKSLPKGVTRLNRPKPYRARININGKEKHLGVYATVEEAQRAYDEACRLHFGEFARPNKTVI